MEYLLVSIFFLRKLHCDFMILNALFNKMFYKKNIFRYLGLCVKSSMLMCCLYVADGKCAWAQGLGSGYVDSLPNARLAKLGGALYLFGGGVIMRSTNGGESWGEVFRYDSCVQSLVECELWMYTEEGKDTFVFYIKNAYWGHPYFFSTDGVEWTRSGSNYIPVKSIYSKITLDVLRDENSGKFVGVFDYLNSDDVGYELGVLEDPEWNAEDSMRIAVYRRAKESSLWSKMLTAPQAIMSRSNSMLDKKPYGLVELQYFSSDKINVVFLKGAGMFYSNDTGLTWKSVKFDESVVEIVGFAEWQDFLVIVHADGRVERIPKNEAFGVE